MCFDDIYVVGCGPSMETFSWDCLRGKPTIAINGSILHVPEPIWFLTACSAFAIRAFRSGFWDTRACRVLIMGKSHKNYDCVEPFIHMFDEIHAPARFDGVIGDTWETFATGKNSGFSGMQYARLMGAKRIHMVGFDLNSMGHFYGGGGPRSATIETFFFHFKTGIQMLHEQGIQVISHTKKSRLNTITDYAELI